jgi:hypothetical protein
VEELETAQDYDLLHIELLMDYTARKTGKLCFTIAQLMIITWPTIWERLEQHNKDISPNIGSPIMSDHQFVDGR